MLRFYYDCVSLHPIDVVEQGKLVQTETARVKQSVISGKYLAHMYNCESPDSEVLEYTGQTYLPRKI